MKTRGWSGAEALARPSSGAGGAALARANFCVCIGSFGLAGSERGGVSQALSSFGLAGLGGAGG